MNNKIMKSGLAAMMAASLVGCSSSSGDNSNNVWLNRYIGDLLI